MRRVWIPKPMYRWFPKMNIVLGLLFMITATGTVSMVLSLVLLGYGTVMSAARVI